MNKFIATAVTAAVAAVALSPSAAPAETGTPTLTCQTVPDCYDVIDQLWPQLITLGAEVNDLRDIRIRVERKVDRKDARIELLQEKLAKARANHRR